MQGAPKIDVSFSMRRDAAVLLMDFVEWQALRGALEGMTARLIADIPCPEDVFPKIMAWLYILTCSIAPSLECEARLPQPRTVKPS